MTYIHRYTDHLLTLFLGSVTVADLSMPEYAIWQEMEGAR